jgi:hypothetical protein
MLQSTNAIYHAAQPGIAADLFVHEIVRFWRNPMQGARRS